MSASGPEAEHAVEEADTVTVKEFVRLEIIEEGKTISQLCSGDDLWVSKNKWMTESRVIDWRGNHYRETITDPETGELSTIVTNRWTYIEGTVRRRSVRPLLRMSLL